LHVLSTPPAFVLSQDQTLQGEFNGSPDHAAHRAGDPDHEIVQVRTLPRRPERRGINEFASHNLSLTSIVNQLVTARAVSPANGRTALRPLTRRRHTKSFRVVAL
jgi:hypothetical protein